MTGLERLRKAADEIMPDSECDELHRVHGDYGIGCGDRVCYECQRDLLLDIADQIERETAHDPSKDVSMSAYDLLPECDRKAISLALDCGGVEEIKKRLMPEGMEWLLEVWPKWSNGEYCKFGDWWKMDKYGEPGPKQFLKLSIYTPEQLREWGQDDGDHFGYEWDFVRPSDLKFRPDKVEPPAPKVLDADGVEIREGYVLYSIETGDSVTVGSIEPGNPWFATTDGTLQHCAKFTHRTPVLAADGKPLRAGETVYAKNYGYVKCTVLAIEWVVDGYLVEVENEGGHKFRQTPDEFTHQRPVLDADGVEIRVGDTVYDMVGDRHEVKGFGKQGDVLLEFHNDESLGWRPSNFTHRAPVLAADGRPLREGETVWCVASDSDLESVGITVSKEEVTGKLTIREIYEDMLSFEETNFVLPPRYLSHESPDSWERLEADAKAWVNPTMEERADLVRRAKKLAGVSE